MTNENIVFSANKSRLLPTLYFNIYSKLVFKANKINGQVDFVTARSVLSTCGVRKDQFFQIVKELESFGLVEFHPYNYIVVVLKNPKIIGDNHRIENLKSDLSE